MDAAVRRRLAVESPLVGPVRLADVGLPGVVFERAGVEYEWPYGDGVAVDLSVE